MEALSCELFSHLHVDWALPGKVTIKLQLKVLAKAVICWSPRSVAESKVNNTAVPASERATLVSTGTAGAEAEPVISKRVVAEAYVLPESDTESI